MPPLVRRTRRRPRGRPGRRHRRWRRRSAPRRRRASAARAWPGPAAEAACSRVATAAASRASLLIRLISVSQSRAAASSASGSVAVRTAVRKPPWAASLAAWIARGSAREDASRAAASCASYERWAVRRASAAESAWPRARVASSQRSAASRRSSAQRSVATGAGLIGAPISPGTAPSSARPVRPSCATGRIARRGRHARQGKGGLHDPPGDRRVACRFDRDGAGHRRTAPTGWDPGRRARTGRSDRDGAARCRIANGRSTIGEASRYGDGGHPPIGRPAAGRFGARCREPVVGQGGRPTGDRVVRDREADLARHRRSSTEDLDERRPAEDAEDEAEGEEAELARRHPARIPRLALHRLDAIIAGPM